MALKTIDQSPTITDQVKFHLLTPDADDCFLQNPYKVDRIVIYYISRSFVSPNLGQIEESYIDQRLLDQLEKAKKAACTNPTEENLQTVSRIQNEIDTSKTNNTFYFKEAIPVATFGTTESPAWIATDLDNALIDNVEEDEDGNTIFGKFELIWNPIGMREGDYIICWTWTPLVAGDSLSNYIRFNLGSNTAITTSIPTHQTKTDKYVTLLDRYLPEMFKYTICSDDLTPEVLTEFNRAMAKLFTLIEDLANQTIDLLDANSIHEQGIPLLSNIFNLRLKSNDPTLWRRQIKQAIPLFKKKGTLNGLKAALSQAGMKLSKFTQLWQVISPYTYQELFDVVDSKEFTLSKTALPFDINNFELYYRGVNDEEWTELNSDYIELNTINGISTLSWIGEQLSINPIILESGDSIRVIYKINEVPNPSEQTVENYIRSLDLADLRDERNQLYPIKNWNVRVIAEDDALFNVIVSNRHPYYDPIVFGKIRTEFPYSENIYNMDSYNGCVVGSTTVITENGLKEISKLSVNDKQILTEFGFRNFETLKSQGKRPTLKITTKTGRKLVVTLNHKFKVSNKDGKTKWKQAKDINSNDYILGKRGNGGLIPKDDGTSSDLWYLAGYAYGDGYQQKQQHKINWLIPESQKESKFRIENILKFNKAKFAISERYPKKHQKHTSFTCNEAMYIITSSRKQLPQLSTILPKYQKKGKWKQKLPESIWLAGESQIGAFLSGIFDTDGGIQGYSPLLTTKWKTLAQDVQRLLLLIGILSSITSYKVEWNGKNRRYFRVRILGSKSIEKFKDTINFRLSFKKLALEEGYKNTNIRGRVRTILGADRTIIPNACNIIQSIFPFKKRVSKIKVDYRTKEEQRIITLLTRLKQGYQTTIPDNVTVGILEKAEKYGTENSNLDFLKDYVNHDWFFDKVVKIENGNEEEVYDPLNVEGTQSYLSDGLVSHNSTRDSTEPCHIDRDFLDKCNSCLSSKYSVEIEIENLSNDRILEAQEVLEEFTPFHAVLHSIDFSGANNEFIQCQDNKIQILIQFNGEEITVAGGGQRIFNRTMESE